MTLSSVAVSRQKGRSRVNKCFMWLIWTLRQANDSASIVKRAKDRLCNSKMLKKAQQKAEQDFTIKMNY